MSTRRVFAIIPAAGQSRRMGRPKQLMPYGEGTILDAVMDAVLEAPIDAIVLVVNPSIAHLFTENADEDVLVALNDDPNTEMIDSVRIGLSQIRTDYAPTAGDGIMVLPGDQPEIRAGVIATCAESYRIPRTPPGILVATYKGRRGHPAIFSYRLIREIERWPADRGLNELAKIHADEVRELPITSAPMPIDVNTPEDYDRLRDPLP